MMNHLTAPIEYDRNSFEMPESILIGADDELFAIEYEPGKLSVMAYRTEHEAESALETGRRLGVIDELTTVRKLGPHDWYEIIRTLGQQLCEVAVVYAVTADGDGGGGQYFWRVPILDVLRAANARL